MSQAANKKKKRLGREELTLNLMILPGMIILIIFVLSLIHISEPTRPY